MRPRPHCKKGRVSLSRTIWLVCFSLKSDHPVVLLVCGCSSMAALWSGLQTAPRLPPTLSILPSFSPLLPPVCPSDLWKGYMSAGLASVHPFFLDTDCIQTCISLSYHPDRDYRSSSHLWTWRGCILGSLTPRCSACLFNHPGWTLMQGAKGGLSLNPACLVCPRCPRHLRKRKQKTELAVFILILLLDVHQSWCHVTFQFNQFKKGIYRE